MIHLFLNDTEVFPGQDTEIQITKENPVMTGSGSYTLDVELPLSIAANRKFFGALDRPETHKEYTSYDMALYADNKTILIGTAVLTKTTEEIVNVQLLSGSSNANFWIEAEKKYIDELDYNTENGVDIVKNWMDETGKWFYSNDSIYCGEWGCGVDYGGIAKSQWMDSKAFFGKRGKFFCAPFKDEYLYNLISEDKDTYSKSNFISVIKKDDGTKIAIGQFKNCHPNLKMVIEKVLADIGYRLEINIFNPETYGKVGNAIDEIYIASAIPSIKLNDMLPHWTYKEFLEQVENLFNATFDYDEVSKIVTLRYNRDYENEVIELEEVIDSQEVELDEDAKIEGIELSNLKYVNTNNDLQNLSEDDRKKYNHVETEIEDSKVLEAYDAAEERVRAWQFYGNDIAKAVVKSDRTVVYCDRFGPLNRNKDNDIELKIVPAKTIYEEGNTVEYRPVEISWEYLGISDEGYYYWRETIIRSRDKMNQNMLSLENNYGGYYTAEGSLAGKLLDEGDNDDGKGSKEDYMPIYIINSHATPAWGNNRYGEKETRLVYSTYKDRSVIVKDKFESYTDLGLITDQDDVLSYYSYVVPFTDQDYDGKIRITKDDYGVTSDNYSLCIAKSHNDWDIAYYHKEDNKKSKLNDNVILRKEFISNTIPNVRAKFLIRGKQYVCQKVEYNITDEGIDPLMTGYFVEIINS